jgi:hypothetical protein
MSRNLRTAWAPFPHDDPPQLLIALSSAVEWTEQQCSDEGKTGLLIMPPSTNVRDWEPLREFASVNDRTTRRGGMRTNPERNRPVLAFMPDLDEVEYAASLSNGSSLCVMEAPNVPLAGWASACGAHNVVTGQMTPPPKDDIVRLLNDLKTAGNNGWSDIPGKRDAISLLRRLRAAAPDLDSDFIAGYMLAMDGVFASGAKQLLTLSASRAVR